MKAMGIDIGTTTISGVVLDVEKKPGHLPGRSSLWGRCQQCVKMNLNTKL